MPPNLLEDRVATILHEALSDATGDVVVVEPTAEGVEEVIDVLDELDTPPKVHLLAQRDALKDALRDFVVASTAAGLAERNALGLRTTDLELENPLVISESGVTALVAAGGTVGGLTTDDEGFVDDALSTYMGRWENGDEYRLHTPPLTRVRETLRTDIGAEVEEDFSAVLRAIGSARGNGDGLDEVTISLLVGARNREQLYDISKWGEDVGIASKATFSRTKTDLEDAGVIETEKVPIDVGRPRMRLKLVDEALEDANPAELATQVESALA